MNARSGLWTGIEWSVCISKSQKFLCSPFSETVSSLYIQHSSAWYNFNSLHNSQMNAFPFSSCQVFYFFWANLFNHFISVSTLPKLAILCLSIFALTKLVIMVLFCIAVERHSFSLLRFLYLDVLHNSLHQFLTTDNSFLPYFRHTA